MMKQVSAKLAMALAVVVSSVPFAVAAQSVTADNASSSPLYFPNVDKNHDGYISRSEVPKDMHDLRVHFDEYDVNKDHRLSVAEYSSYLRRLAASGAGACNNSQQSLSDPVCSSMTGLRDAQLGPQIDTTVRLPAPPPPPPSGH